MTIERLGKGGGLTLSPENKGERYLTSSVLDDTMAPRHKNRHKERLMGFLNRLGFWVSATALVDRSGKQIDFAAQEEKLDFIRDELKQLNEKFELFLELF